MLLAKSSVILSELREPVCLLPVSARETFGQRPVRSLILGVGHRCGRRGFTMFSRRLVSASSTFDRRPCLGLLIALLNQH